ncbi:MAG: protoheme IX farnesyltransferase [Litorivicinaceae bacterium]|nr:protoheme IX farnesyltransferase [Gammaproteobacteria bacterium]RPG21521.1 MAG: protoheme IX farnesyltransferase [Oceanospirillales bacterium TMED33]RZO75505.1 MAG: protoheme IX farnesyltransferase [Litorivicinaceae bacterium]
MAMSDTLNAGSSNPTWRDYLTLTKPRVVAVLVLTSMVGMLLARPVLPSVELFILANLGIGLAASAAAAVNHVVDRRIDALMSRTKHRPVSEGKVSPTNALLFAFALGVTGLGILVIVANPLTALLTFASIIGYAVIYTLYLKRATPQNIVIGGLAGAAPPLLGWVAVTNTIDPYALLLVAIIFAWTPPHFWALCIAKKDDYATADVPMLPVTHGDEYTRLQMFLYTILMVLVTMLPYLSGMSGVLYLLGVTIINARFLMLLKKHSDTKDPHDAMALFWYSIRYIMWLFLFLLVDHFVPLVYLP